MEPRTQGPAVPLGPQLSGGKHHPAHQEVTELNLHHVLCVCKAHPASVTVFTHLLQHLVSVSLCEVALSTPPSKVHISTLEYLKLDITNIISSESQYNSVKQAGTLPPFKNEFFCPHNKAIQWHTWGYKMSLTLIQ